MRSRIGLVVFLILGLSACASQKVKWYLLAPNHPPVQRTHAVHRGVTYIGLEKIHLPVYLQQDKITTRTSNHTLKQNEFRRWAEPLDDNIKRVLTHNLHNVHSNIELVSYPWPFDLKMQYRLQIDIMRFESDECGLSHLAATWYVYNADLSRLYYKRTTTYTTKFENRDFDCMVAAMSKNVNKLSQDIIRSLPLK